MECDDEVRIGGFRTRIWIQKTPESGSKTREGGGGALFNILTGL